MSAAIGNPTEVESVHRQLLASQWSSLPPAIRRLHEGTASRRFAGRCRIERGVGWWSRAIGRVMGFPSAAADVSLEIRIDTQGDGDVWRRDFGGVPLRSRLRMRRGLLAERMGPAEFHFRLVADGSIEWQLVAMRVLGVPMPAWLQPTIAARETAQADRYRFSVRVAYRIVGLLVHYEGWLDEP